MKTHVIIFSVLTAIWTLACSKHHEHPGSPQEGNAQEVVADIFVDLEESCSGNKVLIDGQAYNTAQTAQYDVVSANIVKECLALTLRHTGGCEEATLALYDKGSVLESSPPKRLLRLAITDLDDCDRRVARTAYFELDAVKIPDDNKIWLIIDGLEKEILFEY